MKRILALVGMLACMVNTVVAQDADEQYARDLLPVGTLAPDLIDPTGKPFLLEKFRGRCVVLDFWATWCKDCRKDLPEMMKLHQKYDIEGVEFIGVSFDTEPSILQHFIDSLSIRWGQISELKKMKASQMAKDYHINWIPTMYLLDTDGRVLLATVEIEKLKAKLLELQKAKKLVKPELAGQNHAPQFPGGTKKLMEYLSTNIKYPEVSSKYGIEGRVFVQFYVETDGSVSDVKVSKTEFADRLSDSKFGKYTREEKESMLEQGTRFLKEEALRVVRKMPNWEPAKRRNEPVRVKYTLPVNFKFR